jgi:hypothetical protein
VGWLDVVPVRALLRSYSTDLIWAGELFYCTCLGFGDKPFYWSDLSLWATIPVWALLLSYSTYLIWAGELLYLPGLCWWTIFTDLIRAGELFYLYGLWWWAILQIWSELVNYSTCLGLADELLYWSYLSWWAILPVWSELVSYSTCLGWARSMGSLSLTVCVVVSIQDRSSETVEWNSRFWKKKEWIGCYICTNSNK